MTQAEQREAARQFAQKWVGRGDEKQDSQSYWIDLLGSVLGIEQVTDYVQFERPVKVDGSQKYIDAYIPTTRVLIEQKSLAKDLTKPELQSGGIYLTPYQQAKRYANNLPLDEMPRYIVTCNFSDIYVYDQNKPGEEPEHISLINLQNEFSRLEFLAQQKHATVSEEMQLSIQAGELVGKIHDRFLEQYNDPLAKHTQRSLNILCVRLVFCMYADDAGLFGRKDAFSEYISRHEPQDLRRALIDLFEVLDTPLDQRADLYLSDELAALPYVNGGLFKDEHIVIPRITEGIKQTLIESSKFDWSRISPTIFGAVFESTLNPETRRAGGMHYTSIENIHKVIDPLFMEDLLKEFQEIADIQVIKTQKIKLDRFQDKIASLKFLDPACGSGNFLTETYLSLRRLENEVIRLQVAADRKQTEGQITFGFENATPVKVSISQFYGIEINDFACTVAKTALWIAECQMLQETEDIVHTKIDFLPLKSYANIVEGNALRINWEDVVPKDKLSYIMGNPPFVGYAYQTEQQKEDIQFVAPFASSILDYVAMWYFKAAEYMQGANIDAAFVSTNSIVQGEQVEALWKPLYDIYDDFCIVFAHRTFIWDSEANIKAHVHCVIVGFSLHQSKRKKVIFITSNDRQQVNDISPYLIEGSPIFIAKRKKPLCSVPEMTKGSSPVDDGNFFINEEELDAIKKEPAGKYVYRFYGAREYIRNIDRWVLWLKNASPYDINHSPRIKEKIEAVRRFRLQSTKAATRRFAETPAIFMEIRQPQSDYILIPRHSSQSRRYVPFGFLHPDVICGDANNMVPYATIYHFGILTSNVHMAWMRTVCGRIKSDYRYSNDIVYNNFPWPSPTDEQKAKIEETAQAILDARALYPDSSLADLYDPLTMPPELLKAHQANDRAVMQAYGLPIKTTTEADCVTHLMKMYQELTAEEK